MATTQTLVLEDFPRPDVARALVLNMVKLRHADAPAVLEIPRRVTPGGEVLMQPQFTMLSAVERREYIRERYQQDGQSAVAAALGISERAVKNVAWRLGILTPLRVWTHEEDAVIREWYARPVHPGGFLNDLAALLNRERMAVAIRASRIGVANWHAKKVESLKPRKQYRQTYKSEAKYTPEERSRITSERLKKQWAERGHPRGALGMKHSTETRAKLSAASRRSWADPSSALNSESNRQRLSDLGLQRFKDGKLLSGDSAYSRAAKGRRDDLGGQYFRSSWEANYARYLNLLVEKGHIVSWEYEAQTFWFEAIRRGTRSYLPDFRVLFPDGHHEWHEVKGWMDPKSQTKLKRMAKYYPNEIVHVIGSEWFRQATRSGIAGAIPNWEHRK